MVIWFACCWHVTTSVTYHWWDCAIEYALFYLCSYEAWSMTSFPLLCIFPSSSAYSTLCHSKGRGGVAWTFAPVDIVDVGFHFFAFKFLNIILRTSRRDQSSLGHQWFMMESNNWKSMIHDWFPAWSWKNNILIFKGKKMKTYILRVDRSTLRYEARATPPLPLIILPG